jgi:hypothetical protein
MVSMNQGNHRYTPPAAPSKPKNETYLERKARLEREARAKEARDAQNRTPSGITAAPKPPTPVRPTGPTGVVPSSGGVVPTPPAKAPDVGPLLPLMPKPQRPAASDMPGFNHGQGENGGNGANVAAAMPAIIAETQAIKDALNGVGDDDNNNNNNNNNGGGGGGGGGGAGGGGGGGLSVEEKEVLKLQAAMLQQLLNSDRFDPRDITQELADIDGAVTADQASATAAEGRLDTFINGMGNPYGDMSLTESQLLSPDYERVLTANGAGSGSYKAEVELANTLAGLGNDSDERFRTRMAALAASEQGYNKLANKQHGDFSRSELAASGSALAARLREKKRVEDKATAAEEQQVIMALINALAGAGETVDISEFL